MNALNLLNPYLYHIARVTEANWPDAKVGFLKRITLFHEVEWITAGEGKMLSDGQWIHVQEGDILYRKPGVSMHAFGNYQCYLIVFDPFIHTKKSIRVVSGIGGNRFIGNYVSKYEWEIEEGLPIEDKISISHEQQYLTLFLELSKAFSQQDSNPLNVKIKLLQLLKQVFEDSQKNNQLTKKRIAYKRHSKNIENIQKRIDENPEKSFELEQVAHSIGLSKYHFSRLFKVYTGVNISSYHKNAKLNVAKHLLISTDYPIESIAIQSGFETPTYFYRVFRKQMNMTPMQYREQFII